MVAVCLPSSELPLHLCAAWQISSILWTAHNASRLACQFLNLRDQPERWAWMNDVGWQRANSGNNRSPQKFAEQTITATITTNTTSTVGSWRWQPYKKLFAFIRKPVLRAHLSSLAKAFHWSITRPYRVWLRHPELRYTTIGVSVGSDHCAKAPQAI